MSEREWQRARERRKIEATSNVKMSGREHMERSNLYSDDQHGNERKRVQQNRTNLRVKRRENERRGEQRKEKNDIGKETKCLCRCHSYSSRASVCFRLVKILTGEFMREIYELS